MSEDQYSHLSKVYLHLMKGIPYKGWAKYISALHELLELPYTGILELAAGPGSVSKYLAKKFPGMIVSDLSLQMIKESSSQLNRVCCDMTSLPFRNHFNYIFSTFDSVNYLTTEKEFAKMLSEISLVLNDEGAFAFDVSLENNSLRNVKDMNRRGVYQGIEYEQKSKYVMAEKMHYNHFQLRLENGEIVEEFHKQKIYDFEFYFDIIDGSDFYVAECFDGFSFDDAGPDSERAQFIIKKRDF